MGVADSGRNSRLKRLTMALILSILLFLFSLYAVFMTATRTEAIAGSCPQWEPMLRKYGLPVQTFSRIAWRESRCNAKSVSAVRYTGRPDVGLLQIQGSWYSVTVAVCHLKPTQSHIRALQNPSCNLAVGRYLFNNGGFNHWKGSSK